jgi:cation diffusion facilitator family transporter
MSAAQPSIPPPHPVPQAGHAGEVYRVTVLGLVVNLALTAGKFVAGVMASSQALVADGVHSLSDLSTDIAVLVGVRYWSAPADEDHPYGHGRIETLISLFIGAALAAVGVGIAWRALVTLMEPHRTVPGWAAFAVACASIVSKEIVYRWTVRVGRRVKSPAVIANAWHHRSDAFSSVPVAVAVVAARVWPDWAFLDHIAALIVTAMILQAAWEIARPALGQLIDAGATADQRDALLRLARETQGVRTAHRLRTRHIGTGLQVDLHVLVDPDLTVRQGHDIADAVKARLLSDGEEIVDVLVHVEPFDGEGDDRTAASRQTNSDAP